jgi:hypothetical protein
VTVGGTTVSFNTPQQLKGVWQTYVDTQGPKEFASNADLLAFVKRSAATLLTNPAAQRQFAGFSQLVRNFERLQVLVARAGIVVGGRAVSELRVADNVIGGFLQGVVVGTSHREKSPTLPADTAGNVVIRDNQVSLTLDVIQGHAAGRFGILVGNVRSLLIDSNRISLTLSGGQYLHSEGIRVFGYLGSKAIIRHNELSGFPDRVIRVVQVSAPSQYNKVVAPDPNVYLQRLHAGPQWLIADNLVNRAEQAIEAPSCLVINNSSV